MTKEINNSDTNSERALMHQQKTGKITIYNKNGLRNLSKTINLENKTHL